MYMAVIITCTQNPQLCTWSLGLLCSSGPCVQLPTHLTGKVNQPAHSVTISLHCFSEVHFSQCPASAKVLSIHLVAQIRVQGVILSTSCLSILTPNSWVLCVFILNTSWRYALLSISAVTPPPCGSTCHPFGLDGSNSHLESESSFEAQSCCQPCTWNGSKVSHCSLNNTDILPFAYKLCIMWSHSTPGNHFTFYVSHTGFSNSSMLILLGCYLHIMFPLSDETYHFSCLVEYLCSFSYKVYQYFLRNTFF